MEEEVMEKKRLDCKKLVVSKVVMSTMRHGLPSTANYQKRGKNTRTRIQDVSHG